MKLMNGNQVAKANRGIAILLLTALTGCAGSPVVLMNDPGKKNVVVDGVEYSVSPISKDICAAYRPYRMALQTWSDAIYAEKQSHMKAVALATGCKVIDSELRGPALYATVKCD